ncbi:MAG: hypothetical protein PF588_02800, partial [Candidatus Kapabacteria bacterium]|nr:hypothetical protein [Candidatus Kapabacteria bacterium]
MNFFNKSIISFLAVILFAVLGVSQMNAAYPPTELLSPADSNQCAERQQLFQWQINTAAESYSLEISTSTIFTYPDLVFKVTGLNPSPTSYDFLLPNDNEIYYWRIKTTFTDNSMNYSDVWSFQTQSPSPAIVAPLDNSSCQPLVMSFNWDDVANTVAYHFEMYNSSTMTEEYLVEENYEIASSSYTVAVPQNFAQYYWRVSASFTGCATAWTDLHKFSTAQEAPELLVPENMSTGMDLTSSFTWTQPEYHDTYTFQVSTDADFSSLLEDEEGLTDESYTWTAPTLNTRYYWRVFSEYGGCRSESPDVFYYKTKYVAPGTISPINNRACLPLAHEFKWEEVLTATAYRVQLATDDAFENIVLDKNDIRELSDVINSPEGLTEYFWRVRAEDHLNTGLWSDLRAFTTTVAPVDMIFPANNQQGISHDVVLEWENVSDGAFYHLQLAGDDEFSNMIVDSPGLTSTTFSITVPANNAEYFWRVSASFSDCHGDYPEPWMFKTKIEGPTLLSPADTEDNQPPTIFFKWTEVEGADTYEINLSKTDDFAYVTNGSVGIVGTGFQIAGLDYETAYFWRVRAQNEVGYSDWSTAFSCTTSVHGPEIPILLTPTTGTEDLPTTLTLEWKSSARAAAYHLQVSERDDFVTKAIDKNDIKSVTHEISGLDYDMKYYWRVSAINDSGETRWSRFSYFYTIPLAPDATPELTYPANNATDLEVKFTLRWLPVPRNDRYQIQVALDEYFSGELVYDLYEYSVFSFIQKLDFDTKYFWRVRATNQGGNGPWSDPFAFSIKHDVSVEEEMDALYHVSVYPNPVKENASVNFVLPQSEIVTVKVFNLLGEE